LELAVKRETLALNRGKLIPLLLEHSPKREELAPQREEITPLLSELAVMRDIRAQSDD
jgi:hypothetical protein